MGGLNGGLRRTAKKGDWIVGLTPKADGNKILYFMEVEDILGFDKYWRDHRFRDKRPKMNAGLVKKQGDNIYKPSKGHSLGYYQLPSVHSEPMFEMGENAYTKTRDLKGE